MNKKAIVIGGVILLIIGLVGGWFLAQKQKQPPASKVYSEIFQEPINPSTDSQKHEAVYEKIKKVVDFPVFYLQGTVDGYKLTSIQAKRDMAFETKGSFTAVYEKNNSKIKVIEGTADIGMVKSLEYVDIANQESGKKAWLWEQGDRIGISLYYNSEANYFLVGENTTKEDLIQFAKSFAPIK